VSLEGYGLFLLRADALEKDQATLLEPSSLILPLGLSLEVLLFFFFIIIIAFSSQGLGRYSFLWSPTSNHIARIRSSFDRGRKRRPLRPSISFTRVPLSFFLRFSLIST